MKGKLWNECTQNSVDDIAILILSPTQKESQARIKYVHTYLQSHLLDKTQKRGDNSQLVAVNSNNRKSQSSSVVVTM